MPDEHPQTPPPFRWQVLITLLRLAKSQLVWRRLFGVLLFPPPFSKTPLRPSSYCPSVSHVVKIKCVNTFIHNLNLLYTVDPKCIVWSLAGTTEKRPLLVPRVDPLFIPPPCLASPFLPSFRPSPASFPLYSPASSLLSGLVSTFFSPILPSIVHLHSPSRRFGSRYEGISSYVNKIRFSSKMTTRLVHSVCQTLPPVCVIWRIAGKTVLTRFRYQTVETV